jgi:predicted DsbA family dithiol-disulfide isomerase
MAYYNSPARMGIRKYNYLNSSVFINSMKIEIWSDVMCPFCYIGKRRFENALNQFSHRDKVEIVWKSFQLDPHMKTEPGKNLNEHLAEMKGITIDHARRMHEHVTAMAAEVGLEYNFDKAIVANSFDAHRLVQLAKANEKGDAIEERLFKAYFTEGKNIADHAVLAELGTEAGLDREAVQQMLESNSYADEVQHDIYEAGEIGVRGVPFFLLNDRYAVSGAQPIDTFLSALNTAWNGEKL